MKLINSEKDYDHKEHQFLYRYEGQQDAHFSFITTYKIVLKELQVIKETKCGYWVRFDMYWKKWVSKDGRVKYAYPTKKEALFNFQKRKEKQQLILEEQLGMVRQLLNEIDKVNTNEKL